MRLYNTKSYSIATATALVLAVSIRAKSEPVPAAVDKAQVSLSDVDEVYPVAPQWEGARVLNISEYRLSNKLSSTLVRRLVLAGADYRVENRIGSTIDSWIATGRLRRLLKKHDPSVVIVTLGADVKNDGEADQYLNWAKTIIEQIGLRTCYWVGSRTLVDDRFDLNARLEEGVAPCRYLPPNLSTGKPGPNTSEYAKKKEKKWAERMWYLMNGQERPLAKR